MRYLLLLAARLSFRGRSQKHRKKRGEQPYTNPIFILGQSVRRYLVIGLYVVIFVTPNYFFFFFRFCILNLILNLAERRDIGGKGYERQQKKGVIYIYIGMYIYTCLNKKKVPFIAAYTVYKVDTRKKRAKKHT